MLPNTPLPAFISASNGIRLGLLLLSFLFLIFLFILTRQIKSLNHIMSTRFFGTVVQLLAYLLLCAGIVLFIIICVIR